MWVKLERVDLLVALTSQTRVKIISCFNTHIGPRGGGVNLPQAYCLLHNSWAITGFENEIVNAESYTVFARRIKQLDLSEFHEGMSWMMKPCHGIPFQHYIFFFYVLLKHRPLELCSILNLITNQWRCHWGIEWIWTPNFCSDSSSSQSTWTEWS